VRKPAPASIQNTIGYELTFAILSIISAALLVYEVAVPLSRAELFVIGALDFATVVLFAFDFIIGVYRAPKRRWKYARDNWVNLLAAIPFTSGAFRSFRLFRLFRLVNLVYRASDQDSSYRWLAMQIRSYANLVTFSVVALMAGSIAFYSVEQSVNPNIQSYWDAVWWSFVSATSLGYGDIVPVTTGGRVVAILLMVIGIGIIGTVAGLVGGYTLRRPFYTLIAQKHTHKSRSANK